MKKILISALCLSAFILTACDKKTTDSIHSTTTPNPTSTPQASTPALVLSRNNNVDIKADLTAIDTLSTVKAQQAFDELQPKLKAAKQKNDQKTYAETFVQAKNYMDGFNHDLNALPLKSTEADAIRSQMKRGNDLSLELTKEGLSTQANQEKMNELRQKIIVIQQSVGQDIQNLTIQVTEVK